MRLQFLRWLCPAPLFGLVTAFSGCRTHTMLALTAAAATPMLDSGLD